MKKSLLSCLLRANQFYISAWLVSLMFLFFSEASLAQCACTPLNETFGSTATCGNSQITTNTSIVNHAHKAYNAGGSGDYPDDGEYSIRCDGANVNWGWFGAGGTVISDHTADGAGQIGHYALINSGMGPREFYHKTVTGLCANTTYNLTYYAGNIVRDNMYANPPSLETYLFPSGTAVQVCANKTTGGCVPSGGTLLGSSGPIPSQASTTGFVWNTYSYSFTTGAAQTSVDIVLVSLLGMNAGYDFALDDVTVTKISGSGCSLPVDLLSFTAENSSQNTLLKWSTASEVNFNYFSVEKSEDGIQFSSIGTVTSKGSATIYSQYSFLDSDIQRTSCYYRLHLVDFDGKSSYSEIIKTKPDESFIKVYPNPLAMGEELSVNFSNFEEKNNEVELFVRNLQGFILYSFKGKSNDTLNAKTDLSPGIYIIELKFNNETRFEKLIVTG